MHETGAQAGIQTSTPLILQSHGNDPLYQYQDKSIEIMTLVNHPN